MLLFVLPQISQFLPQMKNDFRKMEDEMDHLATNMASITEFSANISGTLQDRRQHITKLAGVHSLLKKVMFFIHQTDLINSFQTVVAKESFCGQCR